MNLNKKHHPPFTFLVIMSDLGGHSPRVWSILSLFSLRWLCLPFDIFCPSFLMLIYSIFLFFHASWLNKPKKLCIYFGHPNTIRSNFFVGMIGELWILIISIPRPFLASLFLKGRRGSAYFIAWVDFYKNMKQ